MKNDFLLGIDIGGTDTKIGIIETNGSILNKTSIKTNADEHHEKLIERIFSCVLALLEQKDLTGNDISLIGVGAPGILDIKNGIIQFTPNMPKWVDVPIVKSMQDKFNLRCVLENDANSAAWGEKWVGAGSGADIESLVLITLGTGIGGGIIIKNEIWHGRKNIAGELGHITIVPDGIKCSCGNYGCVEAYASATAVVQNYKDLVSGCDENIDLTAENIYNQALNGDKAAENVMQEAGMYLGVLIVNIMHTLNPDIIVIGGGMSAAKDLLLNPVNEEIRKRAYKAAREFTNVVFGQLGNNAGMIGAAGWARKTLETSV